jgi:uncharacterized protein YndB with AHSA1/START domain
MEETTVAKTRFIAEPGKQELRMSRVFDAPRERVFEAYTDARAIPRWWGPRSLTTTVERLEARQGGIWRFVQRDAEGNEFAFHGVFHEVSPPARLVSTFEFEGTPGHVVLEVVTFEDIEGRTRLNAVSVFESLEDRDEMVAAGAESGAVESWERLAELVEA